MDLIKRFSRNNQFIDWIIEIEENSAQRDLLITLVHVEKEQRITYEFTKEDWNQIKEFVDKRIK